jgi:hypothetical protein
MLAVSDRALAVCLCVRVPRGYLPMFQSPETQELIRSLLTNYCINSGMKYVHTPCPCCPLLG